MLFGESFVFTVLRKFLQLRDSIVEFLAFFVRNRPGSAALSALLPQFKNL